MTENGAARYWTVRAHFRTSRFLAGTDSGDGIGMQRVVTAPIPLSSVEPCEVELLGPATQAEYDRWIVDRLRGDAPEPTDEEPDDSDDANEWGGTVWVAYGAMQIIVVADNPDEFELDEGDLPTVFDPSDFGDGPAEVAAWV